MGGGGGGVAMSAGKKWATKENGCFQWEKPEVAGGRDSSLVP